YVRALTEISDIITKEQQFCEKYFLLDPRSEDMKKMMERMFKKVPGELSSLIDFIDKKADRFFCLGMVAHTETKLHSYTNNAFLTVLHTDALAQLNGLYNNFLEKQLASISEYKCIIKKTNVVPYIAKLPFFISKLESVMKDYNDHNKTENTYLKVIFTIESNTLAHCKNVFQSGKAC